LGGRLGLAADGQITAYFKERGRQGTNMAEELVESGPNREEGRPVAPIGEYDNVLPSR
jgi:hypothetical protein